MNKQFRIFTLLLLIIAALACNTENEGDNTMKYPCEDVKILKVLEDTPAIIYKYEGHDAFYFVLETQYTEFHSTAVAPIGEIPKQYRKNGLAVKISGNVTDCLATGGTPEPDIRIAPMHLFELKSIKINN